VFIEVNIFDGRFLLFHVLSLQLESVANYTDSATQCVKLHAILQRIRSAE